MLDVTGQRSIFQEIGLCFKEEQTYNEKSGNVWLHAKQKNKIIIVKTMQLEQ
jgi:hypothetical protein